MPVAPAPTKPDRPPVRRVSFTLRDGSSAIDVGRLHADTREQLKSIVTDESLKRELGIVNDPTVIVAPHPSTPLLSGAILNTLSMVDALILSRVGAPPDVIRQVAPYTDDQKSAIEPALSRVLDKHLSKYLDAWGDEAALVLALVSSTQMKIATARALMATRSGPARVVPIAPVPPPDPPPPPVPDPSPPLPSSEGIDIDWDALNKGKAE